MLKRFFLITLFMSFVAVATAGEFKVKSFNFGEVTSIDASYTYKVDVTYGKTEKVTVSYPEELEENLEISCKHGVLSLSIDGINLVNPKNQKIHVELQMRTINSLSLSGVAILNAKGNFKADGDFKCELSGASKIEDNLNISAKELDYYLSGASKGAITGEFAEVNGELSGAAYLNLTLLGDTDNFECENSGASKLDLTANKINGNLNVYASGAGKVNLTGATKNINIDASGAAYVNAKEMIAAYGIASGSGGSKIDVYGTEGLTLEVSGASNIKYYGIKDENKVKKILPKYAASINIGD